jgi:hypothetical protein
VFLLCGYRERVVFSLDSAFTVVDRDNVHGSSYSGLVWPSCFTPTPAILPSSLLGSLQDATDAGFDHRRRCACSFPRSMRKVLRKKIENSLILITEASDFAASDGCTDRTVAIAAIARLGPDFPPPVRSGKSAVPMTYSRRFGRMSSLYRCELHDAEDALKRPVVHSANPDAGCGVGKLAAGSPTRPSSRSMAHWRTRMLSAGSRSAC